MKVEPAAKQVGSDDGVNRAKSELFDVLISLLLAHVTTEDYAGLVPIVLERCEEFICEVVVVHEYNRLGALREGVKDLLDEVDFALVWTLVE